MNTTELKELAEKATPGPWKAISRGAYWDEEEGDVDAVSGPEIIGAEFVEPLSNQQTTRGHCWYRDAAYIAAANPAEILELIAKLEDAQGEIRALRATEAGLRDRLAAVEADRAQRVPDDIVAYVKGIYEFLESVTPAGYAEEAFRLPTSPTRNQTALFDSLPNYTPRGLPPQTGQVGGGKDGGAEAVGLDALLASTPAPAQQETTRDELDFDSDDAINRQQRNLACALALGQQVGCSRRQGRSNPETEKAFRLAVTAIAKPIAIAVAQNCNSVPHLTFPHIYLGLSDLFSEHQEPPQQEPSEAEMVCAEAYQVVGCLLSDLGLFETEAARKILDNLSEARMVHQDVLPWESAACAERDARIAELEANEKVLLAQVQGHTRWREKIIKASEQAYGESAIRYKFSLTKNGKCMNTFPKDIDGRWFALVPAEDDGHIGHIARIAELTRELEEARKDAERYRWLREDSVFCNLATPHPWPVLGTSHEDAFPIWKSDLDASIDAARASIKEQT